MGKIFEGLKAIITERKEINGLTQKRLANMMGAKEAMVSAILSGRRGLSEEWIERFCAALNIKLGDLEEASPRIYEPKELREYYDKLKQLYETSPGHGFRSASRLIDDWLEVTGSDGAARPAPDTYEKPNEPQFEEIPEFEEIKDGAIEYKDSDAPRPVKRIRVPYYDAVPAGDPGEMNPQGQLWFEIVHSRGKQSWYTLRVTGDSMSPDYLDGDIVLMDHALKPANGDIVAALVDDYESTLKVYSRQDDQITLTPIETKRHSPRTFHASRIKIQGILVEIARRVATRKR